MRKAFRRLGHDAWSCDILPASDNSPFHIQGDALEAVRDNWDLIGLHCPCTFVGVSGQHWISRGRIEADGRKRIEHRIEALQFIERLWRNSCVKMYLENPVGVINTFLPYMPKPQYIQPYQFGDDASKKTGVWSRGLPKISIDPTKRKAGRLVMRKGKLVERWANQTDSGQNILGPSYTRGHDRAITYPGIATAMAIEYTLDCY